MNAGDSNIPDPVDSISHRLRSQSSFFGNWNIAGARSNDADLPNSSVSRISHDAYQSGRFMPLSTSCDVSNFSVSISIGVRDE
jgi:hypothetical protein